MARHHARRPPSGPEQLDPPDAHTTGRHRGMHFELVVAPAGMERHAPEAAEPDDQRRRRGQHQEHGPSRHLRPLRPLPLLQPRRFLLLLKLQEVRNPSAPSRRSPPSLRARPRISLFEPQGFRKAPEASSSGHHEPAPDCGLGPGPGPVDVQGQPWLIKRCSAGRAILLKTTRFAHAVATAGSCPTSSAIRPSVAAVTAATPGGFSARSPLSAEDTPMPPLPRSDTSPALRV